MKLQLFQPKPAKPSWTTEEHQYWLRKRFWYDLKMRFRHRGERIQIDISLHDGALSLQEQIEGRHSAYFVRRDTWTTASGAELQSVGYKKCVGLYDSILFWGVPVYVRFENMRKFDVRTTDANGELIFSQDTAATLHDVMQSNATFEFIKGMGKISMPAMDMQKLGMIAIIGVAAFFGMWMLGVF